MTKQDIDEHMIQRTRVRWTLEAEGVLPPARAAQPRHGPKPTPPQETVPKTPTD